MKYTDILVLLITVILVLVILNCFGAMEKQKDKINELEKALITCLNKSGGFKVGNEFFICEATKVGEDTNAKKN